MKPSSNPRKVYKLESWFSNIAAPLKPKQKKKQKKMIKPEQNVDTLIGTKI